MKIRAFFQFMLIGLIALVFVSIVTAFAAGIDIDPKNVGVSSISVKAQDVKPSTCSTLYLTNIVTGSGIINGTSSPELILGSTGNDVIDGGGEGDCILGGGGDDLITGGDGTDICIGGPGTDSFFTCEEPIQ